MLKATEEKSRIWIPDLDPFSSYGSTDPENCFLGRLTITLGGGGGGQPQIFKIQKTIAVSNNPVTQSLARKFIKGIYIL